MDFEESMRATSLSFFQSSKKSLHPVDSNVQLDNMMPSSQNFFNDRANSVFDREPNQAVNQILDEDMETRLLEQDEMAGVGRLKNKRRKADEN